MSECPYLIFSANVEPNGDRAPSYAEVTRQNRPTGPVAATEQRGSSRSEMTPEERTERSPQKSPVKSPSAQQKSSRSHRAKESPSHLGKSPESRTEKRDRHERHRESDVPASRLVSLGRALFARS